MHFSLSLCRITVAIVRTISAPMGKYDSFAFLLEAIISRPSGSSYYETLILSLIIYSFKLHSISTAIFHQNVVKLKIQLPILS